MGKVFKAALFLTLKTSAIIAAAFIIFRFFIGARICRTNDMYPNIRNGDCVFFYRTQEVTFDDVILYRAEGEEHFGRIVAVPDESVSIKNDSGLWVEDSNVYNSLPYPTTVQDETKYPVIVPEDEFFVLGDLRDQSKDSRVFGCIKKSQVIGKQFYLMRWRGF